MATKNPQGNPNLSGDETPAVLSQAQSTSAEPEQKRKAAPDLAEGRTFYDTTIAKYATVKNAEGKDEEVVVMSDHLDPGEELKSTRDQRNSDEQLRRSAERDHDGK